MRRSPTPSRAPGYGSHRAESFERYYLRNVAIGEGCGCAEHVIVRQSGMPGVRSPSGSVVVAALLGLWRLARRNRA